MEKIRPHIWFHEIFVCYTFFRVKFHNFYTVKFPPLDLISRNFCYRILRVKFLYFWTVKNQFHGIFAENFRHSTLWKINFTLLSRNFCCGIVILKFHIFHTVKDRLTILISRNFCPELWEQNSIISTLWHIHPRILRDNLRQLFPKGP